LLTNVEKNRREAVKNSVSKFVIGLIVGMLLMGIVVWQVMPRMMINVQKSKLNFEDTVSAVNESVTEEKDWKVPAIFDIQKNILDAGHKDMTKVKIVSLCQPHYAKKILESDDDKKVTTMMPLGIGIYETKDGQVYVSTMNIGMMGLMFGGTIADVMGDAAEDIEEMLEDIAKD
jgi:uncharacterized protein (DUF302 family)